MFRIVAALAATVVFVATGSVAAGGLRGQSTQASDLTAAREATAKYRDVKRAGKDGYQILSFGTKCVPGLGYDYVNVPNVVGGEIDLAHPGQLLYAPSGKGLQLVGVQYELFASGHSRPTLFGRPFAGPLPGRVAQEPMHYLLTVWLWSANPKGLFAPSNPRVTC